MHLRIVVLHAVLLRPWGLLLLRPRLLARRLGNGSSAEQHGGGKRQGKCDDSSGHDVSPRSVHVWLRLCALVRRRYGLLQDFRCVVKCAARE
jgi:hypothetical protein